jgi:hypothetical protein
MPGGKAEILVQLRSLFLDRDGLPRREFTRSAFSVHAAGSTGTLWQIPNPTLSRFFCKEWKRRNMANRKTLVTAALTALALGASAPRPAMAQDGSAPAGDTVKCYGINGCAAQAGCGVKTDDIAAVRQLLGEKAFRTGFGKTKTHSCAAHASCGASSRILNWTSVSADACKQASGIVIEDVDGKKVAKKL